MLSLLLTAAICFCGCAPSLGNGSGDGGGNGKTTDSPVAAEDINAAGADSSGTANMPIQQPATIQAAAYQTLNALGIKIPEKSVKVMVSQAGYSLNRDKKVIFVGEGYGRTFSIINAYNGKVVYTGNTGFPTEDKLSGATISFGDFTDLDINGNFYIETDGIGQSRPFTITKDAYENMFLGLIKNITGVRLEKSAKGICDVSFGMHVIMYALQCNGAVFEAAYEYIESKDKDVVTQLLFLAEWLSSQQAADGSLYSDYNATAAFCGISSMIMDTFGKYDDKLKIQYRTAVDKAYAWLAKQKTDEEHKPAHFYVMAQLMRSNYNAEYQRMADEFLIENTDNYSENRFVFYGVLAYLTAMGNENRDNCTHIMQSLVHNNEKLCDSSKEDFIFGTGTRSINESLSNIMLLSFVNYLTPNQEYAGIIENNILYIGGLNERGASCLNADGSWCDNQDTKDMNLEWTGILLFGFSDLLKNLNYAK